MDADIKREFDRLHKKINDIAQVVRKETWVKVSTIQSITIWDSKEKVRHAREQGLVKMRREKGSVDYLLESVNDRFFKQKEVA